MDNVITAQGDAGPCDKEDTSSSSDGGGNLQWVKLSYGDFVAYHKYFIYNFKILNVFEIDFDKIIFMHNLFRIQLLMEGREWCLFPWQMNLLLLQLFLTSGKLQVLFIIFKIKII